MLELTFSADRGSREPVYRQLAGYLRDLVQSERLPPGTKLPATRELAHALGLSRNTVSLAYEDLISADLLSAHVGQGTFVTARTAHPRLRPVEDRHRGFAWSGLFALRARALATPAGLRSPRSATPIRYDFRGGRVDVESLPVRELRAGFSAALRSRLAAVARTNDPLGWIPLRGEIARYLVSRGIACEPRDVAVVNGAQQAIDLVARVLLDPGDTVVMEQPGYFGAALAFLACQCNLVGVGVDAEGLRTTELARVLRSRRVKLAYTTPAAQCPTGAVMSDARRRMLLALADEHQVPIFEDDYDSELRYEGAPVAALKTLDPAGQVIYAGTFSKVLFPGLRMGYVVAAPPLLEKLALARWTTDVETATIAQAALATLLASGGLARHLRRVRRIYAERLAAMQAALDAAMPADAQWTRPRGGHTIWLKLPPGADPDALLHAAAAAGVAYTPGSAFFSDDRGRDTMALSFATTKPDAIATGVAVLGDLVRRAVTPARRRSTR